MADEDDGQVFHRNNNEIKGNHENHGRGGWSVMKQVLARVQADHDVQDKVTLHFSTSGACR